MDGLVTFTSDFGTVDSYVAEVKGVLSSLAPGVGVVDVTHWVEPGNLTAASFVLLHAFGYFMPGTVHLVVVDPGVGTHRDILAVKTEHHVFVGPDNGVLYEAMSADGGGRIFVLDTERFLKKIAPIYRGNAVAERLLRQGPSATFHGRDLFAPLAAYAVGGRPLAEVASERDSMVELGLMRPAVGADGVSGKVVYIDRFGNLISNVEARHVEREDELFLKTGGSMTSLGRLSPSYAAAGKGAPLAIIGSRGLLEIAVNGGSAREHFSAAYGDDVYVMKKTGAPG
jgi:S-adenosylmethionine hydrolase